MNRFTIPVLIVMICVPLVSGCGRGSENQIIEGTGDEVTAEMVEIEERELETSR